MSRSWISAIMVSLAACGAPSPAATPPTAAAGSGDAEVWAETCTTSETFVSADASAVEGELVDCLTGEKIPGAEIQAVATSGSARASATSDPSGRYRLQLPEGRYRLSAFHSEDQHELGEIEVRAGHATVKQLRWDFPRCPPARTRNTTPQADRSAVIAAVLEHYASAGVVDMARQSTPGPVHVVIRSMSTLALPPHLARSFVVKSEADLQREANRSGAQIRFLHIFDLELAGACAAVTVGGDYVMPERKGDMKLCCCSEDEVYLRRGGRWVFRMSQVGGCV
jgi:hypothetical protein